MQDLLSLDDHIVPLGGTTRPPSLSATRAVWTTPIAGEEDAPLERIIHTRTLQLHGEATLHRLGLRKCRGYHSCGSTVDRDWITAFRMLAWKGDKWIEVHSATGLPRPKGDEIHWIDLGVQTSAVIIEIRNCGIDNWWPSWNLATGGLILEGEIAEPLAPRDERLLTIGSINLNGLPEGVEAFRGRGDIRYRTANMEIGFALNRAAITHLGIDQNGNANTATNMLKHHPGVVRQGPRLHLVGEAPTIAPALRNAVEGTFTADGNTVTYEVSALDGAIRYTIKWTVYPDHVELNVYRIAAKPVRVWTSCAWAVTLDASVTPSHVIGSNTRFGQTGLVTLPAWIDSPGHGSIFVNCTNRIGTPTPLLRSEAMREEGRTEIEFRIDEQALPDGDHLIPAGEVEACFTLSFSKPELDLMADTPSAVRKALERRTFSSLSYRPDTATLSNNGASMHCPICMDSWTQIARYAPPLLPNLSAWDLVRDSIERWLDDATGYASGNIVQNGEVHSAEDEYLMTGAAALLGLADFIEFGAEDSWTSQYKKQILRKLNQMKNRDLDGDGLIESRYRTGVSGSGQWSTAWFDVVSFGWKDAIANAILYPALVRLPALLSINGVDAEDVGLDDWARKLHASFRPAFYNETTGWIGGWRCKEDKLHDHAFLAPASAAVCAGLIEPAEARQMMERLWAECQRVGMPDAYFGLPICLWPIPDHDLTDILQGYPFGFYQNGGRTHAQSRHFLAALYKVGMTDVADSLLERLCAGMADAAVIGGCGSGRDWRYWDDRPSGYEGILTDQFGFLAVAMQRWGRGQSG